MHARRRLVASLGGAIGIVLSVAAWVAFAPTQLGGQASYIMVDGDSMQPRFKAGDMAIVRRASSYDTGDIVTYRHPEIGPVIHRIIGREDERFVFKGDHNSFVDGYQPTDEELVGKLWIRVPMLGRWLNPLRMPRNLALLTVVAMVGLGGGLGASRTPGRRPGKQAQEPGPHWGTTMNGFTRNWQDTATILGAVAFGSLLLAIVAFGRPASRSVPADVAYRQAGEFAYWAAAPDAGVYDNVNATTGDPVFRRLSDSLHTRFTYRITSEKGVVAADGTYRLVAEIGNTNGWKRSIELQPGTSFTGTSFAVEGTLALGDVQALIDALESQTGIHSEFYSLVIVPEVTLTGTVAGKPFTGEFAPRLPFKIDPLQLQLPARSANEADPLAPSDEGLATWRRNESNTVPLLFFDLPVVTARWLSLLGVVCALIGAVALVAAAGEWLEGDGDPVARIAAKYGPMLVSVSGMGESSRAVVDVTSIDDLAKLAEREGAVILQEARPGHHACFVQVGEVTYRWQALSRSASPRKRAA